MKPLKLTQAIKLYKRKLNRIDFIIKFLDLTTDMDIRQIEELTLPQALQMMLEYLVEWHDNPEIAQGVTAIQLLDDEIPTEEKIINLGNYRFTNLLTLKQAKLAENRCYLKGHYEFLGFYLLSACCLKGLEEGIETILNMDNTPSSIAKLKELQYNISNVLDFTIDPEYIVIGGVKWSNDFFFLG